jgi:hypothetical protein
LEKTAEAEPIPGVELKKTADVLWGKVCQDMFVLGFLNLRLWKSSQNSPP